MVDVMQDLCDYEETRLENVEKNIEIMKSLGKKLLQGKYIKVIKIVCRFRC